MQYARILIITYLLALPAGDILPQSDDSKHQDLNEDIDQEITDMAQQLANGTSVLY